MVSDTSMELHAKWFKRRVFTQGYAFAVKIGTFDILLISRAPKGQNLANFRSILPLTLEVTEKTPLILHRSPMKVTH